MTESVVNVLMVVEGDIATTQLLEQILASARREGIAYRKVMLADLKVEDIQRDTVPLFIRCGDPSLRLWIERLCDARHPYLYYLDDNFWEIGGNSPIAEYYRHPSVRASLELAVGQAEKVLTNSDVLAAFLAQFNRSIDVLPASFDFSLIEIEQLAPQEEIRIGFAGSPSRVDDLEIIKPIMQPLLKKFPGLVFEFAGVLPAGVVESAQVRYFPHVGNYNEFIEFKQSRRWSIGLAPLRDTPANRCKTDNKYREYSACGIPAVYSNIPPYSGSVTPDVTGLLVPDTALAWCEAIERLLNNADLRSVMAKAAYADVLQRHSVKVVASKWANLLKDTARLVERSDVQPLREHKPKAWLQGLALQLESILVRVRIVHADAGSWGVIKKAIVWAGRKISMIFSGFPVSK